MLKCSASLQNLVHETMLMFTILQNVLLKGRLGEKVDIPESLQHGQTKALELAVSLW